MPRLFPAIDIESIEPISERQVITVLRRDLPDECVILHSWETLRRDRGHDGRGVARLVEGECDAVILWPGKGMLVLEVKGGGIDVDPSNGQWLTRDRYGKQHRIKDPFKQVRDNMHTLVDKVANELGRSQQKLGFNYGYAVVLPSKRTEGMLPASVDTDILCDGSGLANIGAFVERALKLWERKIDPVAKPVKFSAVINALIPSMKLVPSLASRVDAEGHILHRMTQEQARFLDLVRAQPRARVWGVAGSGKTLLAVQQARRFAANGNRTLFLCYNRSLAIWLRDATANDNAPFEIRTFHELCENVTRTAGHQFDVPDDPQEADLFWKSKTPELLKEHIEASGLEYDAIVVDEGQDFRADWWSALACIIDDDASVYAFYDEHQDLFKAGGEKALEIWLPVRLDLPTNCRNTRSIATLCTNIVSIDGGLLDGAPERLAVTVDVAGDDSRRRSQVEKLVEAWLLIIITTFALALASCSSSGEEGEESEYEPDDWFPIGVWNVTHVGERIDEHLVGTRLVISPPIIPPDHPKAEVEDNGYVHFDPTIDYGLPYRATLYQPYTLIGADGNDILCYRHQEVNPSARSYWWGLYDREFPGPLFAEQTLALKDDFRGDYGHLETKINLTDQHGNAVDNNVELIARIMSQPEVDIIRPELETELEEMFGVRSQCHVGGFSWFKDVLAGLPIQDRKTLDLPRRRVEERSFHTNTNGEFEVLLQTTTSISVRLTSPGIDGIPGIFAGVPPIVETATGTFSVRNGMEYWTLNKPIKAYRHDGKRWNHVLTMTAFGAGTPWRLRNPDWGLYEGGGLVNLTSMSYIGWDQTGELTHDQPGSLF